MIICTFENGNQNSLRHVVIDALVLKNDEILLVKRTRSLSEGGKWGLIGGYAERDETIAKAAEREIFEETGWQVKNLKLLTINDRPDRPKEDRQNVSFVYLCEATVCTGTPDWESDEVKWFPLDKLPPKGRVAFDHHYDINLYKKYLKRPTNLPIMAG